MPKLLSAEERLARLEAANSAPTRRSTLQLTDLLFLKQLAAVEDNSPFKLFLCSRRAGKTTGIAADLVKTALETPDCTSLYVTGARTDAKKIVWAEAKRLNHVLSLGGIPNEAELAMTFGSSVVRLAGAKDDAAIEKIRGQMPPVKKAYIDEAQNIRDSILRKLIDDVLEPALLDYDGSLTMSGTPPPVPAGYFIEALNNPNWAVHRWTFFDNPFIALKSGKTHQQLLERVLKRRGLTLDDPSIRREYFGELAVDLHSLVYQYSPQLNDYDQLPGLPSDYTFILGVDLGFHDADALAVIAWSNTSKCTYLVEETVTTQQGITELVEQIERVRAKYDISKIVMDTGGLGKKISEELIRRYTIPIQPADKARKFEHIELFNAALRTGVFKARRASLFASDSYKVEWDRDKTKPDKKVISDRFHSDICDAVLYAWWHSYSFTYVPEKPKPTIGSREYLDALEEEALEYFTKQEEALKDPYGQG